MVERPAAVEAAELARERPRLGIGLHVEVGRWRMALVPRRGTAWSAAAVDDGRRMTSGVSSTVSDCLSGEIRRTSTPTSIVIWRNWYAPRSRTLLASWESLSGASIGASVSAASSMATTGGDVPSPNRSPLTRSSADREHRRRRHGALLHPGYVDVSMIGTAPNANRKCELSAIRAFDARSNARAYGSVRTRRSSFLGRHQRFAADALGHVSTASCTTSRSAPAAARTRHNASRPCSGLLLRGHVSSHARRPRPSSRRLPSAAEINDLEVVVVGGSDYNRDGKPYAESTTALARNWEPPAGSWIRSAHRAPLSLAGGRGPLRNECPRTLGRARRTGRESHGRDAPTPRR